MFRPSVVGARAAARREKSAAARATCQSLQLLDRGRRSKFRTECTSRTAERGGSALEAAEPSRAGLFPHLVSRTPCLSQSDQAFQAAALKPAVDHGALLLPAMNLCTARATSGLPHELLVSDMMRHFGAPGREQRRAIFDASGPSPASEACFVGVCARANRSAL